MFSANYFVKMLATKTITCETIIGKKVSEKKSCAFYIENKNTHIVCIHILFSVYIFI